MSGGGRARCIRMMIRDESPRCPEMPVSDRLDNLSAKYGNKRFGSPPPEHPVARVAKSGLGAPDEGHPRGDARYAGCARRRAATSWRSDPIWHAAANRCTRGCPPGFRGAAPEDRVAHPPSGSTEYSSTWIHPRTRTSGIPYGRCWGTCPKPVWRPSSSPGERHGRVRELPGFRGHRRERARWRGTICSWRWHWAKSWQCRHPRAWSRSWFLQLLRWPGRSRTPPRLW